MHFIPFKNEASLKMKQVFCLCFLRTFTRSFNSNSVSFVEGGSKNISCPNT